MPTFELNSRPGWDGSLTSAMGVNVDIVGYGRRNMRDRQDAQERLHALTLELLTNLGVPFEDLLYGGLFGDSMSMVLPSATDPARALPIVLLTTLAQLAEDNRRYRDRMRIRMGLDFGLVGHSRLGLIGNLIVDLNRLTDNSAIRQAAADYHGSDLVGLISNRLYELVGPVEELALERVKIVVKEYVAPAWLWVQSERCAYPRLQIARSEMPYVTREEPA